MDLGFAPSGEGNYSEKKKKKKEKKSKEWDVGGFDAPPSQDFGASAFGLPSGATDDPFRTNERRVSFSDETAFGAARPASGGSPLGGAFPGGGGSNLGSPNNAYGGAGFDTGGGASSSRSNDAFGSSFGADLSRDRAAPLDTFEDNAFSSNAAAPPPPSALDEALSRAAETRRRADALRHVNDVLDRNSRSQPGFEGDLAGGPRRRMERGFSFSLTDMADAPISVGSPYFVGAAPPLRDHLQAATKWNPLEGIGRHWAQTRKENQGEPENFSHRAPPQAFGSSASILPASLAKPASLAEELNSSESHVQALRAKISRLETDLVSGVSSSNGHLRIVVPHPIDGSKLGVSVKALTIESIADQRALQFGWSVGDRVMQVNGFPVCHMNEFANELSKAVSAYQATGKALVFDIWRPPTVGAAAGGCRPPMPAAVPGLPHPEVPQHLHGSSSPSTAPYPFQPPHGAMGLPPPMAQAAAAAGAIPPTGQTTAAMPPPGPNHGPGYNSYPSPPQGPYPVVPAYPQMPPASPPQAGFPPYPPAAHPPTPCMQHPLVPYGQHPPVVSPYHAAPSAHAEAPEAPRRRRVAC